jgi:hypothetical protein
VGLWFHLPEADGSSETVEVAVDFTFADDSSGQQGPCHPEEGPQAFFSCLYTVFPLRRIQI